MIDAELRRFCEDENAFFFKVSDYTDAIVGDNGFFKIKMAPTVIALVEMYSNEFDIAIADARMPVTVAGFYSTATKKLYMYEGVKQHFERAYINGNRQDFPFDFETMPMYEMENKLCRALTEHILATMKPSAVDIEDVESIRFAHDDYFSAMQEKVMLCGYDLNDIDRSFNNKFLNNQSIALYLEQPQHWLEKAKGWVLADKKMMQKVINILQTRADICAVCNAVDSQPKHPWNVRKRIYMAIRDKKQVTVYVTGKNGKEVGFKVNTAGLRYPNETLYSFYIAAKDRDKVEELLGRTDFNIKDICRIEYGRKEIFKN